MAKSIVSQLKAPVKIFKYNVPIYLIIIVIAIALYAGHTANLFATTPFARTASLFLAISPIDTLNENSEWVVLATAGDPTATYLSGSRVTSCS